ncbi:MAG: sugar ABC transporter substrate-binding protein, partial [Martelella sp.]
AVNETGVMHSGDVLVEQSTTVEPLFQQGTPQWYPEFSSAVNTSINSAAKGQITVEQAMQNIADAAEQAMAQ